MTAQVATPSPTQLLASSQANASTAQATALQTSDSGFTRLLQQHLQSSNSASASKNATQANRSGSENKAANAGQDPATAQTQADSPSPQSDTAPAAQDATQTPAASTATPDSNTSDTGDITPTSDASGADQAASLAGLPAGLAALLAGLAGQGTRSGEALHGKGKDSAEVHGLAADATTGDGKDSDTARALGAADDKADTLATQLDARTDKLQSHFADQLAGLHGNHADAQTTATTGSNASGTAGILLATSATGHAAQSTATAFSAPRSVVTTDISQPGWADDVGNKVSLMLGRKESQAELVLTPSHLGKLEISLKLDGDQTSASFVASSQAARDALEQALPRLREVLQQAGINLTQSDVSTSQQQGRQDQQSAGSQRGSYTEGLAGTGDTAAPASVMARYAQLGMVDTFA